MVDVIKPDLVSTIRRLGRLEPWITRSGLIALLIIVFTIALAIAPLIDLQDPTTKTYTRLGVILGLPLTASALWLGLTQFYLRSGRGIKVGVVDTLSPDQVDNWAEARDEISELAKEVHLHSRISLRLIPPEAVQSDLRCARFVKRYNFHLILQIRHTTTKQNLLSCRVMNKDAIEDGWTRPTVSHIQYLLKHRGGAVTSDTVSQFLARNIKEAIIWLAAARLVALDRTKEAAPLLLRLESILKDVMAEQDRPRAQVRWLYKACYVTSTSFNLKDGLPNPDNLEQMETDLQQLVRFDPTDAGVLTQLARIQFLRGKVDDAISTVENAQQHAQTPHQHATVWLDLAFLHLIRSNFERAATAFNGMLRYIDKAQFNIDDLIAFADLCAEWEHPHVDYIRDLYRRFDGRHVPPEIAQAAEHWLNQDDSRSLLRAARARYISFQSAKRQTPSRTRSANNSKRGRRRRRRSRRGPR